MAVRGEFACPYAGNSAGRTRGIPMTAYGEFRVAAVTISKGSWSKVPWDTAE